MGQNNREWNADGWGGQQYYTAAANILPSRFVKFSTLPGQTGYVFQAGLGDTPQGVSDQGTYINTNGVDEVYTALKGQQFIVYTGAYPSWEPYIEVDAAYPQGTFLKPGIGGIGTIASDDNDIYGAILLEQSRQPHSLVRCRVVSPSFILIVPALEGNDYEGPDYFGVDYTGTDYA